MAGRFLQAFDSPDHADFLKWIAMLGHDELRIDFGLEGRLLEDVASTIGRIALNPLLSEDPVLPIETFVAGIRYGDRRLVAQQVREGDFLRIERDYDNLVDRNAIALRFGADEVGYLPRTVAQLLALDIDTGKSLMAQVSDVESGRVPRVQIKVAEADQIRAPERRLSHPGAIEGESVRSLPPLPPPLPPGEP
jgi:hypothetical protein